MGVGIKPDVCPGTCRTWHAACKDEFFSFDSRSHTLVPCPEGSTNSLLICSKLHTMAADGNELCELAGARNAAREASLACTGGSVAGREPGPEDGRERGRRRAAAACTCGTCAGSGMARVHGVVLHSACRPFACMHAPRGLTLDGAPPCRPR